jgi:thymidylate synthase (FAD)
MSATVAEHTIQVFEHGYVKFIEHWGSDERIVESARMSTDKGFLGWGPLENCKVCGAGWDIATPHGCNDHKNHQFSGDEQLLKYLFEHRHTTPFEFCGLVIEVQAPILVFRQWERHRTQSYNEMSGRYTSLPDLFYIPSIDRIIGSSQKNSNKQASGKGTEMTVEQAEAAQADYVEAYEIARRTYEGLQSRGISNELARCVLPVAQYSRLRATANLKNWLDFMTLRCDHHAQWETQQYANVVEYFVKQLFPRTYELWAKKFEDSQPFEFLPERNDLIRS